MADFVAITGKKEDRAIEFVDHLHEHFVDPVRIVRGRYMAPTAPGFSAQMHPASIRDHLYPDGIVWQGVALAADD
jgi:L-fuconate dehydratase